MSSSLAPAFEPLVLPLPSGVAGLDEVLGGGIPERSFTVITGAPGTGKTTLAHQILSANASGTSRAVYCVGSGDSFSRLRLDHPAVNPFASVFVVDLGRTLTRGDTSCFLDTIAREVEEHRARIIAVDLVRALVPDGLWKDLVLYLSGCPATTFLVTDLATDANLLDSPIDLAVSVADSVVMLQHGERHRTLKVLKVRGQQTLPGAHIMRLTEGGMQVLPRWGSAELRLARPVPLRRVSSGAEDLDRVLGGGMPVGATLLLDGQSGTGKSVLAAQFVAEGGHGDEPGLVILFDERPDRFIAHADAFGLELGRLVQRGLVDVLSFRGRDLAYDELIADVVRATRRLGTRRLTIDSVDGLALALGDGPQLNDGLWRLLDQLGGAGVTTLMTADRTAAQLQSLVDGVVELRQQRSEGRLEFRLAVLKMRSGPHSREVHAYEIGTTGFELAQDHALTGHAPLARVSRLA